MLTRFIHCTLAVVLVFIFATSVNPVYAWDPVPVKDDPLVRMPGTQPGDGVSLEDVNRCLNCHAGYFRAGEPGFNWQGSMMAHAARDPIFWATMVVAAQDSIWAVGRPNATDICLRCHMPKGWLEGRSDPTNAAAMKDGDFDGVQCDFCHRMYDPFFATTHDGLREGSDWEHYWDETNLSVTPSQPTADATLLEDIAEATNVRLFNDNNFFVGSHPHSSTYTENGGGQYFVSTSSAKRASFADADARHRMLYSRYHKSKYFCSSCHDVSNPVLENFTNGIDYGTPAPLDGNTVLPTESYSASSYFHVERTFSEFMLSAYGAPGGDFGIGPFAPDVFNSSYEGNRIAKCQDCHMRDIVGRAANKNGAILRPEGSVEHPNSGLPLHDLSGGNIWVPYLLASAIPGSANYIQSNENLLGAGPEVLTLDLNAGQGVNPEATLAGMERAKQQLQMAAAIENLSYDAGSGELSFRIQNQTGHKLISGYPEGRRMFINIKALDANGNTVYEVNPYDAGAGTLKGLDYPYVAAPPPPDALSDSEAYMDALVYEAHMNSSLTAEDKTFHFALATGREKDNRIPPKGFRINEAEERLVVPVWQGVSSPNYYSADEYAGGYDDVNLTIAANAAAVEVNLYYQTTSREYMEFLHNEITGTGAVTLQSGAYVAQTDPFFAKLKAWGDTMWQLWVNNKDVEGAAPFLMAQAAVGDIAVCGAPAPTLLSAVPSNQTVALTWSDELAGDANVDGYALYYDQAGKSQLIDDSLENSTTSYTDNGLLNGIQVCYKVTSHYDTADGSLECESTFSNTLCAVPDNQPEIGADYAAGAIGHYITTGKGKNQVTVFEPTTILSAGDDIVIRATVLDGGTHLPVANATVELAISGPDNVLLTTDASNANGIAEVVWPTAAPNKQGQGGTPVGTYTVTIKGVAIDGYTWDGIEATAAFVLQ